MYVHRNYGQAYEMENRPYEISLLSSAGVFIRVVLPLVNVVLLMWFMYV